jgi:hypothetical protein
LIQRLMGSPDSININEDFLTLAGLPGDRRLAGG